MKNSSHPSPKAPNFKAFGADNYIEISTQNVIVEQMGQVCIYLRACALSGILFPEEPHEKIVSIIAGRH